MLDALQIETPNDALIRLSADDIGLKNSLPIAVDIRSWLLQHFEPNFPALQHWIHPTCGGCH